MSDSPTEVRLTCPHCAAPLAIDETSCACPGCQRDFPVLLGIADLRISQESWVEYEPDRLLAARLASMYREQDARGLIAEYWRARGAIDETLLASRLRYISLAESKYREQLAGGWIEGPPVPAGGRVCLEVGCGPGAFLLAAAERFSLVVGIDICLAWLVIAKKRIEEAGRKGLLVCACAESLPFAEGQFDLVGLLDAIEHVTDRARTLQEISRVTRTGGTLVCTTPNRFSLSAEPHTGVWGVGLLPRALMASYVKWRAGKEYQHTHLLSLFELRALARRAPGIECEVYAPAIFEEEVQAFPLLKRRFASAYNRILRVAIARRGLLPVAPFFVLLGKKIG